MHDFFTFEGTYIINIYVNTYFVNNSVKKLNKINENKETNKTQIN